MTKQERAGLYPPYKQPAAGKQTVKSDAIDSLALHIALVGIAVLIGYGIKELLILAETAILPFSHENAVMPSVPLFPLCMIGGVLLQQCLHRIHLETLVNHGQIQRINGAALDFLVIAAITSIKLEFVIAYWIPLSILIGAGIVWNIFAVLYIGPRIFDQAWFERSIAEFGQAMGVTATGLMLLRTIDPDNQTVAMRAFGYKQLLHEPIMGGGLWTSVAVPLVMYGYGLTVWYISAACLVIGLISWLLFFYHRKSFSIQKRP